MANGMLVEAMFGVANNKQWTLTLYVIKTLPNSPLHSAATHKKKLALKSFQLIIKRTHSVKIASLYL